MARKKPGPGHPVTTGMAKTPPIHFRLSKDAYRSLKAYGKQQGLSPSLTAKGIVELYLNMPDGYGGTRRRA